MSSVESNKMSKKTPLQDSNSKLQKAIEAKKCDDFMFENRDFDDNLDEECLNRGT